MPAGYTWISTAVLLVAVPAVAFLWWALAFLPWMRARVPLRSAPWPPTLPAVFTDLDVAVFGPLGASLIVVALLRRTELAFLSILIGFGVSGWVTLGRGADINGSVFNTSERYVMLTVCAVAAFIGLAIGVAAIRSLKAFGFLGLLAAMPVAALVGVLLLRPGADERWLIRSALVLLLLMIAKSHWVDLRLWPIFCAGPAPTPCAHPGALSPRSGMSLMRWWISSARPGAWCCPRAGASSGPPRLLPLCFLLADTSGAASVRRTPELEADSRRADGRSPHRSSGVTIGERHR